VVECEIGCILFEPRRDATKFVGVFSVYWSKGFFAVYEAIGGCGGKAKAWQFAFAPRRLQSAMVQRDTTERPEVDVNVSGSAELIELALSVDGAS
jgi:hypothetical protein